MPCVNDVVASSINIMTMPMIYLIFLSISTAYRDFSFFATISLFYHFKQIDNWAYHGDSSSSCFHFPVSICLFIDTHFIIPLKTQIKRNDEDVDRFASFPPVCSVTLCAMMSHCIINRDWIPNFNVPQNRIWHAGKLVVRWRTVVAR